LTQSGHGGGPLGYSERQFSIQKCDILFIPDVALGTGKPMRRREFITLFGGAAAAWPLAARAQQPGMPIVGFLSARSREDSADLLTALRAGLGEMGFVENRNITIEFRWAEDYYDR
jgi:hypothetical protein